MTPHPKEYCSPAKVFGISEATYAVSCAAVVVDLSVKVPLSSWVLAAEVQSSVFPSFDMISRSSGP